MTFMAFGAVAPRAMPGEDVFGGYSEAGFRAAFAAKFEILDEHPIPSSERSVFLMRRKG